jgi:hypothetical protein
VETAGGAAGNRTPPHGDVPPFLDVADRDASFQKRPLKGEGAAEEEGDQVVTPVMGDVSDFFDELTVPIDPVSRKVSSEVSSGGKADRLRGAGLRDLDERTGAGVPLTEEQEIVGGLFGKDHEVRLDVARSQPRGGAGPFASTNRLADLLRVPALFVHRILGDSIVRV